MMAQVVDECVEVPGPLQPAGQPVHHSWESVAWLLSRKLDRIDQMQARRFRPRELVLFLDPHTPHPSPLRSWPCS